MRWVDQCRQACSRFSPDFELDRIDIINSIDDIDVIGKIHKQPPGVPSDLKFNSLPLDEKKFVKIQMTAEGPYRIEKSRDDLEFKGVTISSKKKTSAMCELALPLGLTLRARSPV
jgi:hypothetical protein